MNQSNNRNPLFSIIKADGREFVGLKEVVRLKSEGNCTWIFLICGRSVLTSKNLGYYEKILPKPGDHLQNTFYRVHNQHLLNLGFIAGFNSKKKYLSLASGIQLPIAQRRLKPFQTLLKSFSLY